jgi:hypothetical protein
VPSIEFEMLGSELDERCVDAVAEEMVRLILH